MSDTSTPKKWVKVTLGANSAATVTLVDSNLTGKSSVKVFRGDPKSIRAGITQATKEATEALDIMREFQ